MRHFVEGLIKIKKVNWFSFIMQKELIIVKL